MTKYMARAGRVIGGWCSVVLLALWGCGTLVAADAPPVCSIDAVDRDADGVADDVVLENPWHRLVFRPSLGGSLVSWIYKPLDKELSGKVAERRVFVDIVAELAEEGKRYPCQHPYAYEIVENSPQSVSLAVYAPLPALPGKEAYSLVTIRRTYTLHADSPAVDVAIAVSNAGTTAMPLTLMVQHWNWVQGESSWYYVPDAMGVQTAEDTLEFKPSGPLGTQFPVAAWSGYISSQSGLGLAYAFEWRYLDAIENWLSSSEAAAVQWPYLQQQIPAGGSWQTAYRIFPTEHMGGLDAVSAEVAVGVRIGVGATLGEPVAGEFAPGQTVPVEVTLAAPKAGELRMTADAWILPDAADAARPVGQTTLALKPAEAGTWRFDYLPERAGRQVLRVRVWRGEELLLESARPFAVGDADRVYFASKPEQARIGISVIGRHIIDPELPDFAYSFDRSWETPHVNWAKPYAGGQAQVLFVSQANNTVGHWRELWERGDIEFSHTVTTERTGAQKYPYHQGTQMAIIRRLNTVSDDTVLFLAGLNWSQGLNASARDQVFALIRNGHGAVITGKVNALSDDPVYGTLARFLATGKEQPEVAAAIVAAMPIRSPSLRVWQIGKGRVVLIDGPLGYYDSLAEGRTMGGWRIPGFREDVPGWEYSYGMLLRAIYAAAGQVSPLAMDAVHPAAGTFSFALTNSSETPLTATASISIRDQQYALVATDAFTVTLGPGKQTVPWTPPPTISGQYLVDVIWRDAEGRSLAWGGGLWKVRGDLDLRVRMDRSTAGYFPAETATAILTLDYRLELHDPVPLRVHLEATDRHGRAALDQWQTIEITQSKSEHLIVLEDLQRTDIHHDLTVSVYQGDRLLGRDYTTLFLFNQRSPIYEDFQIGSYGITKRSPLHTTQVFPKLRELGVDEVYTYKDGRANRDIVYRNGMWMAARPDQKADFRPKSGPVPSEVDADAAIVTPSLSDPGVFDQIQQAMHDHVQAATATSGIDVYIIGDEWSWAGVEYDFNPENLVRFRDWLRSHYASLEALNTQWDTAFTSWSEVMPTRSQTKNADNLSSWWDFRNYMTTVWTEYVRRPYLGAKAANPNAAIGHEGVYLPGTRSGSDIWQWAGMVSVTSNYGRILEELYRSCAPETITGSYGGYNSMTEVSIGARQFPWRVLLHGGHWANYYMIWDRSPPFQGMLDFDGSPHGIYPMIAREEWDPIKSGIGKLFIDSSFTDDGIAFPYSPASIYCAEALGENPMRYLTNHYQLVQHLGRQHHWFSTEEIRAGELIRLGYRALILPRTICLSDAEIAAIQAFAEAGGTVIADSKAGVRDEHGKLRASNPLETLLGVAGDSTAAPVLESRELRATDSAPDALKGLKSTLLPASAGVQVIGEGSQVWCRFDDGTPAVVVTPFGRGRFVYTNLDLSAYGSTTSGGQAGEETNEELGEHDVVAATRKIFDAILAQAGVPRRLTVSVDGETLNGGETFYYEDGDGTSRFIALMNGLETDQNVTLALPQAAHLYDVRDGGYLGRVATFQDTLRPGHVEVYAALPYRVAGMDVAPVAIDLKQGDTLSFTAKLRTDAATAAPGMHIFRLTLRGPDGVLRDAYTVNLRAEKGAVQHTVPLAFNDTPGEWTILVEDVISKTVGERSFRVSERN